MKMEIENSNRDGRGTRRRRVILVEDSQTVALYVKDILRDYEVIHYQNPTESFSALPDAGLLLLDYALPEMDGIEYLKFIKKDFPWISVILITGQGSEDVCRDAFRLGVKDYLKKPFSPADLRAAVKSYLGGKFKSMALPDQYKEINPVILNRICLAKKYIDDNINKNLHMNDVLKIACMSKSGFCKSFKVAFGTTFKDYFLKCKMERARQMLQQGLTVTEVSSSLDYADSAYFARIFKKVEGMSPSAYLTKDSCD